MQGDNGRRTSEGGRRSSSNEKLIDCKMLAAQISRETQSEINLQVNF